MKNARFSIFVISILPFLVSSSSASLLARYTCDDDLTSTNVVINSAPDGWGDAVASEAVKSRAEAIMGTALDFYDTDWMIATYVDTYNKISATGDFTLLGWTKLHYTARTMLFGQYLAGESGRMILYSADDRYGNVARFGIWDGASDGATDIVLLGTTATDDGEWHHLAVTREGNEFTLYVDGVAEDSDTLETSIYQGHNLALGNLAPFEGGTIQNASLIDEASVFDHALSANDILQHYEDTLGDYLYKAKNPVPARGEKNVDLDIILNWQTGKNAVNHKVYFGESSSAVKSADVNSSCYMGQFDTNSFDLNSLELLKTYYWRVDEIDDEDIIHKGEVWSFSTIEYVMVEDFESYDNDGNDVTAVWVDVDTSGAGDMQRFLANESSYPVLSSINSLRLRYRLTAWGDLAYYAKTSRSFSPAQDWTAKGVKMLTVNYYGDSDNFGLPMFVTVGDGTTEASVYVDANTLVEGWNEVNASLPEFAAAGIDLTNVSYMEIGFGDGTNLGSSTSRYDTLYIDDILLYPAKCVLSESSLTADVTRDCVVNYDDIDQLIDQWLTQKEYYNFSDAVSAMPNQPVGLWFFNDSEDLLNATIGSDLTVSGEAYRVEGITDADGAATVDQGDYFICTHGIDPESGDDKVYTYTLVFNIKVPSELRSIASGGWASLISFRGSPNNGDIFLCPGGIIGTTETGYSPVGSYNDDEWFQIALVSERAVRYDCYVNGEKILEGGSASEVYERLGLSEEFYIFADFDGDHQDIPVRLSSLAIFDQALSDAELQSLVSASIIPVNFNSDKCVDFKDYSLMADEWLVEDFWP